MQAIKQRDAWLIFAATLTVVFDLFVIVAYAVTVVWFIYAVWICVRKLRGSPVDKLSLLICCLIPVVIYSTDLIIQNQVNRDLQILSQNRNWINAKNLNELLDANKSITWITRTRLLVFGYENNMPVIKARAFPAYVLKYNLQTGMLSKYDW